METAFRVAAPTDRPIHCAVRTSDRYYLPIYVGIAQKAPPFAKDGLQMSQVQSAQSDTVRGAGDLPARVASVSDVPVQGV